MAAAAAACAIDDFQEALGSHRRALEAAQRCRVEAAGMETEASTAAKAFEATP